MYYPPSTNKLFLELLTPTTSSGLQKHSGHLGQLNEKNNFFVHFQVLRLMPITICHPVTFIDITNVRIVVLDYLGLQSIPGFVLKIPLSWR
jgi:hypothetical protein